MNHQSIIQKAIRDFYDEEIPNIIPEELPLLSQFRSQFPNKRIFSDTDVVFIQHHLGPLIPKVEAMVTDGLEKKCCWFVDIPYSTNERVRSELLDRNYLQDHMTIPFHDPIEDYDENMASRVIFLMMKLAKRDTSRKLLVIDDGAYFARFLRKVMLHYPELREVFCSAGIVEQTTRGHRFLEKYGQELVNFFDLRIVSIARCKTKIEFEAPFIGAAVARAIHNSLKDKSLPDIRQIAVIGFGAVGEATLSQLTVKAPGAMIDIVEVDKGKRNKINLLGSKCRGINELDLNKQYELVIGCTGYDSFRLGQRNLLADKALLVSGSSAAVEFNRAGFVELADRYPDDDLFIFEKEKTRKEGIHATITILQEGRKSFSFLNAGFPVNFDGRIECLPVRIIQATHTLLFAAAIQSLRQTKKGLCVINEKDDHWIYDNALNAL
jgi:S-adenosylhomocysteine hydrolase